MTEGNIQCNKIKDCCYDIMKNQKNSTVRRFLKSNRKIVGRGKIDKTIMVTGNTSFNL
jgi:hypothetical protein